jgi:hypothetical protein
MLLTFFHPYLLTMFCCLTERGNRNRKIGKSIDLLLKRKKQEQNKMKKKQRNIEKEKQRDREIERCRQSKRKKERKKLFVLLLDMR